MRKPSQVDLENIVGHFLHYLSNEPGKDGISPRFRLYGQLPVESKLLFPDVSDEVILAAVQAQLDLIKGQKDPIRHDNSWRSYP